MLQEYKFLKLLATQNYLMLLDTRKIERSWEWLQITPETFWKLPIVCLYNIIFAMWLSNDTEVWGSEFVSKFSSVWLDKLFFRSQRNSIIKGDNEWISVNLPRSKSSQTSNLINWIFMVLIKKLTTSLVILGNEENCYDTDNGCK